MLEHVFHPRALLSYYLISSTCILQLPLIDELTNISELRSDRRDAQLSKGPIVLITSKCKAHDLLTRSFHGTLWERCLIGNL